MKCPSCSGELVWMGHVIVRMSNPEKYFRKLTKKAFSTSDIELVGVAWDDGSLYCRHCGMTIFNSNLEESAGGKNEERD